MADITRQWTDEQLDSDALSKKDILTFLQQNASQQFQVDHKLKGKNAIKSKTKKQLGDDYILMFEAKAFKTEGEEELVAVTKAAEKLSIKKAPKEEQKVEEPKYTKKVLKKGDKKTYPQKGDSVELFYTGKLADGTIFESNVVGVRKGKKPQAFPFKIGNGSLIRGLDEALLTMSVGEKVELVIEPEWAYGKNGYERKNKEGISIPPNETLTFELEIHRTC
ncbi:peptidyl-prolyl cis-trans isomerase FKBP3-like [Tubulanus polymorphus]|uniref:peptidyl-prolyl cis-trans isomerase FKBP3-like n=1 Tax=Tubulanus polymorphus TaxID=672921 RepID=UPI003DA61046